jgi:hypothetical protein
MVNRKDEIEAANLRAAALLAKTPTAVAARYDRRTDRVVIDLSSRLTVSFNPKDAQGLDEAKPEQLAKIEISPSGLGLHFPKLDADLYLPSLLEGFLGSRRWMAAQLGKAGGKHAPLPRWRLCAPMANSVDARRKWLPRRSGSSQRPTGV